MADSLKAFIVGNSQGWSIEPAGPRREWMDNTPGKGAYRCLPLSMANQAGWLINCPVTFFAKWDGGVQPASLKITFPQGEGSAPGMVRTHFGNGIITFRLPWLFRTPPGYGMLVRGPTNSPRDAVSPLDGLVETDWAPYTFTMNWKITRPNTEVWFKKNDPICMVLPYPLDLLESLNPQFFTLDSDQELKREYTAFYESRTQNLNNTLQTGTPVWQKHYFKGAKPDGTETDQHRSNLKLGRFADPM